jgi:hypothetical protein
MRPGDCGFLHLPSEVRALPHHFQTLLSIEQALMVQRTTGWRPFRPEGREGELSWDRFPINGWRKG